MGEGDPSAAVVAETERGSSSTACRVYRCSQSTVVTAASPASMMTVAPLAELLLTLATATAHVIVLTARHVSELKSDDPATTTHCLATDHVTSPPPCASLQRPNIISGLAAAVLTLCQVRGKAATLLVHWAEVLTPDSISLAGFLPVFNVKSVSGAGLKQPGDISEVMREARILRSQDNIYM